MATGTTSMMNRQYRPSSTVTNSSCRRADSQPQRRVASSNGRRPLIGCGERRVIRPLSEIRPQKSRRLAERLNHDAAFNNAVNFLQRIRARFQTEPQKYRHFTLLLDEYCRVQGSLKESNTSFMETNVYKEIAILFENNEDLLREFGDYLPTIHNMNESNTGNLTMALEVSMATSTSKVVYVNSKCNENTGSSEGMGEESVSTDSSVRSTQSTSSIYANGCISAARVTQECEVFKNTKPNLPVAELQKVDKKKKMLNSIFELNKNVDCSQIELFHKMCRELTAKDEHETFMRCIDMYNKKIFSPKDLLCVYKQFASKFPELYKQLKLYMRMRKATPPLMHLPSGGNFNQTVNRHCPQIEELSDEVLLSCRQVGASYRMLPSNYVHARCTGRTALCDSVLNESVILHRAQTEGSFSLSRKSQLEQLLFRIEDERFELDIVIEMNCATIRVLERMVRTFKTMSPTAVAKFKLDDRLGGDSATIHHKAICRIYGHMGPLIIEGLKKSPSVVVPVVLTRLKAKDQEWRKAQKTFNKIWAERMGVRSNSKCQDQQMVKCEEHTLAAYINGSLAVEEFDNSGNSQIDLSRTSTEYEPCSEEENAMQSYSGMDLT